MMYVASIQGTIDNPRLVLSNHDHIDFEDFEWSDIETRDVPACYDTLLDVLSTIVDRTDNVDYILFVGAEIQSLRLFPQWFYADCNKQVEPTEILPKILDFGTVDIYWDK